MSISGQRPLSIRIACGAAFVAAALSVFTAGYYLLDTAALAAAAQRIDGHSTLGALADTFRVIAVLSLLAAAVTLSAARAVWAGQRWAWRWLLGTSGLGVLSVVQPTTIALLGVLPGW